MYIPCIHIYIFKYIVSIYHDDAPDFLGAEKGQLQNSPWSGFGTLSASLIFSELDKESFKDFRSYKMLQAGHQTVVSYGFLDFLWCLLMGRKTTLIIWKKTCSHILEKKKRHWKRGYLGIFQIPILLLEFQGLIPFSNLAPQGRLRCGGRHRSPRPQRPEIWRTQLVTVSSCNFFNSPSKWSFSTNAAWSKSHQIPKLHGCICSMNKIKINTAWSASPPEAKLSWLQIHGISWDIQWFNYLMVCPCKPKFQESRKLRPQTGDDSCPVTENPTPDGSRY